jgi:hypothetical protein
MSNIGVNTIKWSERCDMHAAHTRAQTPATKAMQSRLRDLANDLFDCAASDAVKTAPCQQLEAQYRDLWRLAYHNDK